MFPPRKEETGNKKQLIIVECGPSVAFQMKVAKVQKKYSA